MIKIPLVLATLATAGMVAVGVKVSMTQPTFVPLPESRLVEGSISFLDRGAADLPQKVVVLTPGKEANQEMEVKIDPQETVVMQGGRVTELGQLENGQKVKVRYREKGGFNTASVIEITDPLPVPEEAKEPPPVATQPDAGKTGKN